MNKIAMISLAIAATFSDQDVELKTGADYCYANPLTTFETGAQRNADLWPDPCERIVIEYETSGAKAKYDEYYLQERQEMIKQLKRIK